MMLVKLKPKRIKSQSQGLQKTQYTKKNFKQNVQYGAMGASAEEYLKAKSRVIGFVPDWSRGHICSLGLVVECFASLMIKLPMEFFLTQNQT